MTSKTGHHWQFFRAGGFDQVRLESAADLAALRSLDQKLWATLTCPVVNLELDPRMLSYIDSNGDGRIRAPEILDAVDWTLAHLADPEALFREEPVTLSSFNDSAKGQRLTLSARRLLQVMGRAETDSISIKDTEDLSALFPAGEANGDGLVPATMVADAELKQVIGEIISCLGGEKDRSGEQAVSATLINEFFAQAKAVFDWHQGASVASLKPFGEHSASAIAVISKLRDKVDDYFTRVELAAYDPRAADIMNAGKAELERLSALSLADTTELAELPLANLQHGAFLPLREGVNPAWQSAVEDLREWAVKPLFGDQDGIDREQWREMVARGNDYFAWWSQRPDLAIMGQLSVERIVSLVEQNAQELLLAEVARDMEQAGAAEGLVDLDKLLRFKRGLLELLRNFVSFYDFYSPDRKAVFQAGRLYIDGKSCDLVVQVADANAHAAIAAKSESFLLYCNCVRKGQPVRGRESMTIVAAVTAGAEHEMMVGRNGLFYDRDGNDWDATVIKVVENAISVRLAFWSPYRRVAGMVSDQIQKMASSRDNALVTDAASKVGPGAVVPAAAAPAPASAAAKTFDIAKFAGIFAAIGLALGALGAALAAVFTGLLSLQWWQWPLVLVGIIAAISGPSMLMAWFKLRRRSLGPILDANGWAVNTRAKISIPFGTTLTQLPHLPEGSARSLRDPYAEKRPVWPALLAVVIVLVLGWTAWERNWLGSAAAPAETPAVETAPEAVISE